MRGVVASVMLIKPGFEALLPLSEFHHPFLLLKLKVNYNIAKFNHLKNRHAKYLIIITHYIFNKLIHMKNKEIDRNILQYFY